MDDKQLKSIEQELFKMDKVRDKNVFYLYYPKGIADLEIASQGSLFLIGIVVKRKVS